MFYEQVIRGVLEETDTVFLILVVFGTFYGIAIKNVESVTKKRWLCTVYGIINIFILFGFEAWHIFIAQLICAFLIVNVGKGKCHIVALAYYSIYISAFRIWTPNNAFYKYKNLCVMMLFLRGVGVAFEINYSYKGKIEKKEMKKPTLFEFSHQIDPTFSEILHYIFTCSGIHFGPYFRYRTYDEFLHLPFARAVSLRYCAEKFILIFVYAASLAIVGVFIKYKYTATDEFANHHFLFKIMYVMGMYIIFQLTIYSGMCAGECSCGSVGLGAYPVSAENYSLHGPTKGYDDLRKMTFEVAKNTKMDFETLRAVNVIDIQKTMWFTDSIRIWNKNVQYFMGMFVYKTLPRSWNRQFRYFLTLEFSILWHGFEAGYTIGMFTPVLLVPAEKTLIKIYTGLTGWKRRVATVCQYLIRMFFLSYGVLMVLLLDGDSCLKCTKAIYFSPFVLLFFIYLFVFIYNMRNVNSKKLK